ncbi:MAG TPA: hypothetical protein VN132_03080 [Bdellovibrio sp.]|nr:hypothetical protein [Bdellovibrio sp.]
MSSKNMAQTSLNNSEKRKNFFMDFKWTYALSVVALASTLAAPCVKAQQVFNNLSVRGLTAAKNFEALKGIKKLPSEKLSKANEALKSEPSKIDFKNLKKFEFQKTGGVDGSGGGSVLSCVSSQGEKYYQLVDYYEASLPNRNIPLDLGPKSLSVEEKIELVLGRLAKVDPVRASNYADAINAFYDNIDSRTGQTFGKTPDVIDEIVPNNCQRLQVIIQINPSLPGDKRFIVNDDVWKWLDNTTKAGLILHEIAYHDQGLKDARRLRYFNAWLASSKLTSLDWKTYGQILFYGQITGVPIAEYNLYCTSLSFDKKGRWEYGYMCKSLNKDGMISLPSLRGAIVLDQDPFTLWPWMLEPNISNLSPHYTRTPGLFFVNSLKVGDIEIISNDTTTQQIIQLGWSEEPEAEGYYGKIANLRAHRSWVLKTPRTTMTLEHLINNNCNDKSVEADLYIQEITPQEVVLRSHCYGSGDSDAKIFRIPR